MKNLKFQQYCSKIPKKHKKQRLQWLKTHKSFFSLFFSTYSSAWPCRFAAGKKMQNNQKSVILTIKDKIISYQEARSKNLTNVPFFWKNHTFPWPSRFAAGKKIVLEVVCILLAATCVLGKMCPCPILGSYLQSINAREH